MLAMYQPEKLGEVDAMLLTCADKEEGLLQELVSRFGAEPPIPPSPIAAAIAARKQKECECEYEVLQQAYGYSDELAFPRASCSTFQRLRSGVASAS